MAAQLTQEEYLLSRGSKCPACGSNNIESLSSVQVDGPVAWLKCLCGSCQAIWDDEYTLSGYSNLEVIGE